MSKKSKASQKLRGAQKWIVEELRGLGPSVKISTSQIAKRISKARGKTFHKNSIYNALRILVQRGHVTMFRDGHEKFYRMSGGAPPAVAPVRSTSAPPRAASAPAVDGAAPMGMLPHKLALGEILVVGIEGGEVITATNLHGRLVLERHPIPS
jgi:hypothetical protein